MCKHDRIKSVNCVLYCMDCGAVLPADFLAGEYIPDEKTPAEGEKKPVKRRAKRSVAK